MLFTPSSVTPKRCKNIDFISSQPRIDTRVHTRAFVNKLIKKMSTFKKGNIEISDTDLIVHGYYFCFGSCSTKRVKLSDIESVKEMQTTLCNSKTCGQACSSTWWHCDPTNGCLRECRSMKGLILEGKNFSVGLTLSNDDDFEAVKKLLSGNKAAIATFDSLAGEGK